MQFRSRQSLEATMDITPLIDAVLLLLIFFMVSSSFVVQPGIKIELPESESGELKPKDELRIVLGANGELYYMNRPVTLEQLADELRQVQSSLNKASVAIVQADKRVPHGKVVEVLDVVERVGLNIAIGTEPRREEAP